MTEEYAPKSGYMTAEELKKKMDKTDKILEKAFEGIDEMLARDKKRSEELDELLALLD